MTRKRARRTQTDTPQAAGQTYHSTAHRPATPKIARRHTDAFGIEHPRQNHLQEPYMHPEPTTPTVTYTTASGNAGFRTYATRPYEPAQPDATIDEASGYPKPGHWDQKAVLRALKDAMDVLRRMPMPSDGAPMGHKSNMPEYVHAFYESFASMAAEDRLQQKAKTTPTIDELAWMDEVLSWLTRIRNRREAIIVSGLAMELNLRAIGRAAGCSHQHAKRIGEKTMQEIADWLNERASTETHAHERESDLNA